MAMAMATLIFMGITALYSYEARSLGVQHSIATMDRDARFALEHLRRDLITLGSNTTPNSAVDGLVCPKPDSPIRVIELSLTDSQQVYASLNPFVRTLSVRLFGSLDIKTRFVVESIAGPNVVLQDNGTLPSTDVAWRATFTKDRFLRLAGPDGRMMFYPIQGSDRGSRQVTLSSVPARVSGTQPCGYQANGEGLSADVQGYIRYRIIIDKRPEAPVDTKGLASRTILVRERLAVDGKTVTGALPLADNVIELGIYDAIFDSDPNPDRVGPTNLPDFEKSGLIDASGGGVLGGSGKMMPERLRAVNVVLSLRSQDELDGVRHDARTHVQAPLTTFKLSKSSGSACLVHTVAGRVPMPIMTARNL
ncbi:MAG TPA: hypothetical protein DCQ06_10690 [Myxococcales bacterium]|nr:hypothetical protein [Myxococcales bacterium]